MKIDIASILENQFPSYVREDYPLSIEFLKQYYYSDEESKLVDNIDEYIDLDYIFSIDDETILEDDIDFFDDVINVTSTKGFPDRYGIFQIDDEIITYTSKTDTSFNGCVRGFSAITEIGTPQVVFEESTVTSHNKDTTVHNLSVLFLKQFFLKIKQKIAPGFENRSFYSNLNVSNFLKKIKNFYQSKGTKESFRILFGALYGKNVEVLLPRDRLFSPSNAQYRVTRKIVAEALEGNPEDLVNGTLYQDADEFISDARGTIANVERIIRGGKQYYSLSLDSDYNKDVDVSGSIKGEFIIHPTTSIRSNTSVNSTVIDVDSTISFPKSGKIRAVLSNGGEILISYTDKSITQFLGCTGIIQELPRETEIMYDSYAYGKTKDGDIVKLRITGVLDTPIFVDDTYLYNKKEAVEIETLGIPSKLIRANEWKFNIPLTYDVEAIEVKDSNANLYSVTTFDNNIFSFNDEYTLFANNFTVTGEVAGILNTKTFIIQASSALNTALEYRISKNIKKVDFLTYPELNVYNSNIQNTYVDIYNDDVYVASSSLPAYTNSLSVKTGITSVFGTFTTEINIPNHIFYTGDAVVYTQTDNSGTITEKSLYFVKKVDSNTIKLATSPENIFKNEFLEFSSDFKNVRIEFFEFTDKLLTTKRIKPQKILKKLSTPKETVNKIDTLPGAIGIFNNGVEILNYKSNNQIYHGPIEKVVSLAPGENYDLINPQKIVISDSVGVGASVYPVINGNLKRIDVLDGGFDYLNDPSIRIEGGNGKNAIAKANMVLFNHVEYFNALSDININNNNIVFTNYHKFRRYEEVVYNSNSDTVIGGLVNNQTYFVLPKTDYAVTLHKTYQDAFSGINSVDLTSTSSGLHYLQAKNKKKKISSVTVINSGEDYQYKKVYVSGINTSNDSLEVKNHNFKKGELVFYTTQDQAPSGLTNNTKYYVLPIDNDNVRLCQINSNEPKDFYYTTNQYINITSKGQGKSYLQYEPITVTVDGIIGVGNTNIEAFKAQIIPVFRGGIVDVTLESGGSNYGSEIINYNRQPQFNITKGTAAQLKPVISNGRIVNVIVQSPGNNYFSHPDLIVEGDGYNAILTPVVVNGQIVSVKVNATGFNYTPGKTIIRIQDVSLGAKITASIKTWKINLFERYYLNDYYEFGSDDGVITNGIEEDSGLKYTHLFAARELRKSSFSKKIVDGEVVYQSDLNLNDIGKEEEVLNHSPILGWAYDGNPIYGPYGYNTPFNSNSIKRLVSGYSLKLQSILEQEGRPDISTYPFGFFVEDYEYTDKNSPDLDIHNGRFCATPEFPNGTYAYFTTFSEEVESSGSLINYKKPVFPYVVGNSFYSEPVSDNYTPTFNQDNFDFNSNNVLRNIIPYNLTSTQTYYDFFKTPYKIKPESINIKAISQGTINSFEIANDGNGYKINDLITFENDNKSVVSSIKGKTISGIAASTINFNNIEFSISNEKYVGYNSVPHNINDGSLVVLQDKFGNTFVDLINVAQNKLTLAIGIGSTDVTGIVTYFSVYGNLDDSSIKENDIYLIENEKVKVLNIDIPNSRLRVSRGYDSIAGVSSHTAGVGLTEQSRKLTGINRNRFDYNDIINKEFYFNPKETLGLGVSVGVGYNSTLYFESPGIGATFLNIPTGSLYIPNHKLQTNDRLIYKNYENPPITISIDSINNINLTNFEFLYASKINENLIGLSTIPIGVGSTGNFIGIGTSNPGLVYLTGTGSGRDHSFITQKDGVSFVNVGRQEITLTTSSNHELQLNDYATVETSSKLTKTITVKYSDANRRIILNPKSIESVDIQNDSIKIANHGLKNGDKVIYEAGASPIAGLTSQDIYYVISLNNDQIRLATSYYNSTNKPPTYVLLTTSGDGYISPINPPIELTYNDTVIFDLSDLSLGYVSGSFSYSSFDFDLYKDAELKNVYLTDGVNSVIKTGTIGVSAVANLTFKISSQTPEKLYYDLKPLINDTNPSVKLEKIIDKDQSENNKITIKKLDLNNTYRVLKYTNNSFTFELNKIIQPFLYTINNLDISYSTNSLNVKGEIHSIRQIKKNPNNQYVPGVVSIKTGIGSGAIIKTRSNEIGEIKSFELNDIGFEYSSDKTLRPKLSIPKIVDVIPFYSVNTITVENTGANYYFPPTLVLIDNYSQTAVSDLVLEYLPAQKIVNILRNSTNIRGTEPYIIPTNNSVGVPIENITYDSLTKQVTVVLDAQYSDIEDFPFANNDKVLIESVVVGDDQKGYNSSLYKYSLFEISNIDANIGGVGASFTYSMSNYLSAGEELGTYDKSTVKGKVVPQKYFPSFTVTLNKNDFIQNEVVFFGDNSGKVVEWNPNNQYIKILTKQDITPDDILFGQTSKAIAIVKDVKEFDIYYNVMSSSVVNEGWKRETGFFNNDQQRLHDNDYYQYFSYSIKSEVPLSDWNEIVDNLNHPAGFKKFSDLQVISDEGAPIGIGSSGVITELDSSHFIYNDVNMNCVDNFDLASENYLYIDGSLKSNEIYLKNTIIQDYIESVSNRVLTIDDIGSQVVLTDEINDNIDIDSSLKTDYNANKYYINVIDKWNPEKSQFIIVTTVNDTVVVDTTQYAELTSLGYFDGEIESERYSLKFYPENPEYSSYYINSLSFNIGTSFSGLSTIPLGDSSKIEHYGLTRTIGVGTTSIIGISSSIRCGKILISYSSTDNSHSEFDEITFIHDGNEIIYNNYGELITSENITGVGTYNLYYSDNEIKFDLISSAENKLGSYIINVVQASIANTSISGVGTTVFGVNTFFTTNEFTTGITTNILSYSTENNSSYSIICIQDVTNNKHSVSEVVTTYNPISENVYYTEFGNLDTNNELGIISAIVENSNVIVKFTPTTSSNYYVRSINYIVGNTLNGSISNIDSGFDIKNNFSYFEAGIFAGKKAFELYHNTRPLFKRTVPSLSISTTANTITIPEHYFVTGEELEYSGSSIGIGSTVIGIGTTTIMPDKVYVVKLNETTVRVAASASEALFSIPNTLGITTSGIGSQHTFTSNTGINRCIIGFDNIIQAPLTSFASTSSTLNSVGFFNSLIKINNPKLVVSGDLLKVEDEIVKVLAVGYGSTNALLVDRGLYGTTISSHDSGSIVTKFAGNYNIIGNTIYFDKPPYRIQDGFEYRPKFTGRTFLRSKAINSQTKAYSQNYIFDSISNSFDGITKQFTLKSNGSDTVGFASANSITLINNVIQVPNIDFTLSQGGSSSTINFTGSATSISYDVNNASIPRGGIIIDALSFEGKGYQPLVSAGGTAVVSAAGTILSVSIGNSGSGYRGALQTVRAGILSENLNGSNTISYVGIASITNGNIVGVSITNPGIGYTNFPTRSITSTSYTISAGSTIIPLLDIYGLKINDIISVGSDIANAPIIGIGSTTVLIGSAYTTSNTISGFTSTVIKFYNPPKVFFDEPLSYSNIPLIYASGSSGVGTEARIDIVVGQGSSVIHYEITNAGYGYRVGDVLTLPITSTGIVTDSSLSYQPFKLTVNNIFNDAFNSWVIGDLQLFDSIESNFDGSRKAFKLKISNTAISIQKKKGSNIDLVQNLIVILNDVIQVPNESYNFTGGNIITFNEAPRKDDTCSILFYRGTSAIDTVDVDIIEDVKIGDNVTLNSDERIYQEESRLVSDILSANTLQTLLYSGAGITSDINFLRPLTLCRQTEDIILNDAIVGKNRVIYSANIYPSTNIISNVSTGSTDIFVQSVKTFFDDKNEYFEYETKQRKVRIISQNDNSFISEEIEDVSYEGDFGTITGIKTSVIGIGTTAIVFQFFIPPSSILRKETYITADTSELKAGQYFYVNNTNIGSGLISYDLNDNTIGIGTTFADNIYQAYSVSIAQTAVPGVGVTNVLEVTSKVDSFVTGVGYSGYYGDFSWGRLHSYTRKGPKQFVINPSGISTSAIVQRLLPLKYQNYNN